MYACLREKEREGGGGADVVDDRLQEQRWNQPHPCPHRELFCGLGLSVSVEVAG